MTFARLAWNLRLLPDRVVNGEAVRHTHTLNTLRVYCTDVALVIAAGLRLHLNKGIHPHTPHLLTCRNLLKALLFHLYISFHWEGSFKQTPTASGLDNLVELLDLLWPPISSADKDNEDGRAFTSVSCCWDMANRTLELSDDTQMTTLKIRVFHFTAYSSPIKYLLHRAQSSSTGRWS